MTKEEAIEILSDMRAEYNIFSDNEEEATRYHALSWAIQALNERTGRWIPVSERLPEDSYGCIVAYHGFMMTPSGEKEYDAVYHETVGFDGQGWNNANGENIDNLIDVTAWMPLPEPYKGGQE